MDYAVRNTRVLARRALSAIRRYGPAPPELADAVALLGDAVLELGNQLEHPERDTAARRLALEAAVKATRLLQDDPGLSISVIIGQVRSTAIDLLRGSGMTGEEARTALDAAVERAGAAASQGARPAAPPGVEFLRDSRAFRNTFHRRPQGVGRIDLHSEGQSGPPLRRPREVLRNTHEWRRKTPPRPRTTARAPTTATSLPSMMLFAPRTAATPSGRGA